MDPSGTRTVNARAIPMDQLVSAIRGQTPEIEGMPLIDKTGFTGKLDVEDLEFSGTPITPGADTNDGAEMSAPSLSSALEKKLGLQLTKIKAPVEVIVIDSTDRPTEN